MNLWYQICATRTQNRVNVNESNAGVCRFFRVGRPTDRATCLHLILLVLCICSRCECQGDKESNVERFWSVTAAGFPCSSELTVIWRVPRSLGVFAQRLELQWVTTRGVKISWSYIGGFPMIFLLHTSTPRTLGSLLMGRCVDGLVGAGSRYVEWEIIVGWKGHGLISPSLIMLLLCWTFWFLHSKRLCGEIVDIGFSVCLCVWMMTMMKMKIFFSYGTKHT